jgi:ABC-2 type transport system permease protein
MSAVVSGTVVRLARKSVFGRRRGILLIVLPLVLIGLSVLIRVLVGSDPVAARHTLQALGLVVVTPLVALLAATGVLSPEIDDGSIAYLLAKPMPRSRIVLSKLLVALGCVVVFAAAPTFVAGLLMRPSEPRLGAAYAVGSLAAGLAYCAIFLLLSVLTRHAVVVGLIYLLVWESLLGGLLDGVRWLSVSRWAIALAAPVASLPLSPDLGATYAVIATAVVLVGATWLTVSRLRGVNLTGDE